MRSRAASVAGSLALASVLLVSACGGDESGSAQAGDLVRGRLGEVEGTTHSLLLPNGLLTVVAAEGPDSIGPTDAADGREHPAPDGAEWLTLDWELSPGEGLDPFQRTLMEDTAQRTTLELVAGDATTELGDAPGSTSTPTEVRTGGTVYVAVASGESPVVEVTFDGVTTSLDLDTGSATGDRADALADLAAPESAECPPLRGTGVSADVACTYTLTRVPYLSGQGWSDGDGWTVAQVETRIDSFTRAGTTYDVQGAEDASGFDGTTGESTVVDERLTSLVTRVVVDGNPSTLDIARTLTGLRADGQGPEDASAELTGTVELG
ncbi:hypothetical protein SAMN04489844_0638 [Nocardioides exalbidus]|uniref:Lipoprotein n=1 Tax=Nocardioides exalbidus TaxID=402596 RepID=A0A1H4KPK1_9ACTN|nr:hypothetical protein [Nocardioides exalbidus]SEB59852.1 hypothetical protein SAMN04489844_0638 [Nocardioides exalbidus]